MNSSAAFTQTIARRLLLWGAIRTISGVILQLAGVSFRLGMVQQADRLGRD